MTTALSATLANSFAFLLAHEWDGITDLTGWLLSEKLDGVRALWDPVARIFISRGHKVYAAPEWFKADMPDMVLDGELWLGRGRFNECSGICRRGVGKPGADAAWRGIRFVAFDAPLVDGTAVQRFAAVDAACKGRTYAVAHQHLVCTEPAALAGLLKIVVAAGGEGLMARKPDSRYLGHRSTSLLKIKLFKDCDAVVLGVEPGAGKHAGRMGALRVRMVDSGVEFKVGSGFSDKERDNAAALYPKGTVIVARFFELSADGVPRFPTFSGVRAEQPCASCGRRQP